MNELYALTAIGAIAKEQGTNAKIELAAEYLKDYPDIRYLLEAALSPYKHYGVTKRVKGQRKSKTSATCLIGAIEVLDYSPKTKETFQQFDDDLYGLGLTEEDIDLVWKIVTKKLKIGIDVKGLNKAGYNLPTFECMLAATNKDNSCGTMPFPALLMPKLDGCRMLLFPKRVALGRSGKPVPNKALVEWLPDTPWVLDGEFYMHGVPFDEISGLFRAKDRPIPEGYRFHIFNAFTEQEWNNQQIDATYDEVMQRVRHICGLYPTSLVPVGSKVVDDEEAVSRGLQELWDQGYEGGILRNVGKPAYMWKRCSLKDNCMIKLKKIDYTDAKIVGFVEGEGKYSGMLGALQVQLENGIDFEIGTGYTDDQRVELWQNRDELLGEWVHCKFTELTETGMPRPPVVFMNIRDSKG